MKSWIRVIDNSQKTVILPFPELPKNLSTVFIPPTNIDKVQSDILKKITVDLAESKNIENITVRQSLEPELFEQRKLRLTASKYCTGKKHPQRSSYVTYFNLRTFLRCLQSGMGNKMKWLQDLYFQGKCRRFVNSL